MYHEIEDFSDVREVEGWTPEPKALIVFSFVLLFCASTLSVAVIILAFTK